MIDWQKWGLEHLAELHERASEDGADYVSAACPACGRERLQTNGRGPNDAHRGDPVVAEPVCEKCGWRPSHVAAVRVYDDATITARVREPHESEHVDVRPIGLRFGGAPEMAYTVEELEQLAHGFLEVARRAAVDVARRDALREERRAGFEGARAAGSDSPVENRRIENVRRAMPHLRRALERAGLDGAAEDLETLLAEVDARSRR